MKIEEHMHPDRLERYSFLWSQARLILAAIALFAGGVPVAFLIFRIPAFYGLFSTLLTLCWIISGAASAYLLYRWYTGKQMLFGGKAPADTAAFLVSAVSGINLGLTGLFRNNIGMSVSSNRTVFIIVGLIYLAACYHLHKRWTDSKQKVF